MGATTFSQYGLGKTPEAAFAAAHEYAAYMHGHGGYTGTLAEKGSYVLFKLPPRCTIIKLFQLIHEVEDFQSIEYMRGDTFHLKTAAQKRKHEADIRKEERRQASFWRKNAALAPLLKAIAPVYDDKWGPAVALEITGAEATRIKKQQGRAGTRDRVFLFCGWASC